MTGVEIAIAAAGLVISSFPLTKLSSLFTAWNMKTPPLKKLYINFNSVQSLLRYADQKLIKNNEGVNEWVEKARFAIYDVEDLLERIAADLHESNKVPNLDLVERKYSTKQKIRYSARDFGRSIHPMKNTVQEKLEAAALTLREIADCVGDLRLEENDEIESYRNNRLSTSLAKDPSTLHGRSTDLEKIIQMLNSREGNDDVLRVVPIVGMGGVGKTTLASMVFHHYEVSWFGSFMRNTSSNPPVFGVKGWVCVSDQFDKIRFIKQLLEPITGKKSELDSSNLELLERALKNKLKGKVFLVVLDDIWDNLETRNWEDLKSLFSEGARGSRILVTTRYKKVSEIMHTSQGCVHHLNVLAEEDDCWLILKGTAFPRGYSEDSHRALGGIGRQLLEKCKGLPLAIKVIGRLLSDKKCDEKEWRNFVDNENIWRENDTEVKSSLWLSYYHLPRQVKQCFAYFSTFPKGYLVSEEKLIMLWMAEGFIEKNDESLAKEYFHCLASIFFIQQKGVGKPWFVHDLVHELAMDVSRGSSVNLDALTLQSRRFLSYIPTQNKEQFNNKELQNLYRVRTFLPLSGCRVSPFSPLSGCVYQPDNVPKNLLSKFEWLRILSLKRYNILKLPDSICGMKFLKYLDLSMTDIKSLPDKMCRLHNLQTLLLCHCKNLSKLPDNIHKLVNLSHLNIEGTNISIPDGIEKRQQGLGCYTTLYWVNASGNN